MPNLIWFEWVKCPDGYSIEVMEAEYFDFEDPESGKPILAPANSAPYWVNWVVAGLSNTTPPFFSDSVGRFDFPTNVVVPKSERVVTSDRVLDESPGAFRMFADCADSEEKALYFIESFGYPQKVWPSLAAMDDLRRRFPEAVRPPFLPLGIYGLKEFCERAGNMAKLVRLWEEAKSKGDYRELIFHLNELTDVDSSEAEDALRVSLRENRADRGQAPLFSIRPRSLEDALWLQFRIAVSNNTKLQQCSECPTWFAFGAGTGRRKSAIYCSPRCSKAAYRRRKAANE